MSKKLKVTKIEVTTADGKTVSLTMDEARELHAQLDELFGSKVQYVPSAPVIIERDRWPWRAPYWHTPVWASSKTETTNDAQITCRGDSGLSVTYQGSKL